jgi:hypothetical protein
MARRLVLLFACAAALQLLFATIAFRRSGPTPQRAVLGMGIGLYLFWIILGGLLMRMLRKPARRAFEQIPLPWTFKFVLFATALACVEEVVTVSMTHTAPLYGVTVAQAHVTASPNYWDVILTNSVVLFVPMFCIWAAILARFRLSPSAVFLLWGVSGTLLEMAAGGPRHILEIGMWVFVYGLMIYLPAYSIPDSRTVRPAAWWLYPLFVIVPLAGIIPGGILAAIFRHLLHPQMFPPA